MLFRSSGLPAIAAVSGGNGFSLALTADGVVYGWGRTDAGQLGFVRSAAVGAPVPLALPLRIAALAAGTVMPWR